MYLILCYLFLPHQEIRISLNATDALQPLHLVIYWGIITLSLTFSLDNKSNGNHQNPPLSTGFQFSSVQSLGCVQLFAALWPKYAEPKGVERKTQEAFKAAVPSAPLFGEDEFPLPSLPPSPGLTAGEAQAFPSLQQTAVLSPLQKGICWTQQEGDLDSMTMAFPVIIHEWIAPGTDPNNPNGVYEAVPKQIPFKTLKELKQAVQNYGVNSPFTLEIVQGQLRVPI